MRIAGLVVLAIAASACGSGAISHEPLPTAPVATPSESASPSAVTTANDPIPSVEKPDFRSTPIPSSTPPSSQQYESLLRKLADVLARRDRQGFDDLIRRGGGTKDPFRLLFVRDGFNHGAGIPLDGPNIDAFFADPPLRPVAIVQRCEDIDGFRCTTRTGVLIEGWGTRTLNLYRDDALGSSLLPAPVGQGWVVLVFDPDEPRFWLLRVEGSWIKLADFPR